MFKNPGQKVYTFLLTVMEGKTMINQLHSAFLLNYPFLICNHQLLADPAKQEAALQSPL